MSKTRITSLYLLAVIIAGAASYMLGRSQGKKDQYVNHILLCQMYGDVYRATWNKIFSSDHAAQASMVFHQSVTNSVADIRAIVFSLEDYLSDTSVPPDVILSQNRDEIRKSDQNQWK